MRRKEAYMQNFHEFIIRLNSTYRRITTPQFRNIELTKGQPKVLDYLVLNNGCIQKDIAENCYIEPATVTSLLAIMENKELLIRKQNKDNRRILNVFLTEKGFEQQKLVQNIFNTLDEVCFSGFSEEEILETKRLLAKVQANLDRKANSND